MIKKQKKFLPVVLCIIFIFLLQSVSIFAILNQNPFTSPNGTATMHGDVASSDVTPYKGPGTNVSINYELKQGAVSTILAGADGMPVAIMTKIVGRKPAVVLIDPTTSKTLATLNLDKGSLLGGIYAFMDNHNRLVVVDGSYNLLKISHSKDTSGKWHLKADETIDISDVTNKESVVGLVPDCDGRIWFATDKGTIGFVGITGKIKKKVELASGETIANGISSSKSGVSVASTHALYLLKSDSNNNPIIVWRKTYDRGKARKPGQLSWGTGATPTFFGPNTGYEYVTITDNAFPKTNLLIFRTNNGEQIAKVAIFDDNSSGTENSPIAYGRSVYVASTYGYGYPALPDNAGKSEPSNADFKGGMQRIDVLKNEKGAKVIWTNKVRSCAVPRLSIKDNQIYTFSRESLLSMNFDGNEYFYTVIDPGNGNVLTKQNAGFARNTLQMVGTIMPNGRLYQGTILGLFSINAK